jgi:hypothetical protein
MRQAILIVMLAAAPVAAETKVFQAKHRPSASLAGVLGNIQGILINHNREFNTVALNGSPENIKVAEALLEKYDTPRRQAEFLLRVIEAGSGVGADKPGPNDAVELVPAELKSMLKYNRYTLLDSAVLRGMEAEDLRLALANNLNGKLRFNVRESALEMSVDMEGPPGNIKNNNGLDVTHWPRVLSTTATAKSGETVVLGASKMRGGNNALIVLVTAKLLP